MADINFQFKLTNAVFAILKTEAIWFDDFFSQTFVTESEKNFIHNKIVTYMNMSYETNIIGGFLKDKSFNMPKILKELYFLEDFSKATVEDLEKVFNFLFNSRIKEIKSSSIDSWKLNLLSSTMLNGYIIVNDSRVSPQEFGIEQDKNLSLLIELSQLKNSVKAKQSAIDSYEEEIKILQQNLSDKNNILAGRASLSWS
jgi:hypothetical protein